MDYIGSSLSVNGCWIRGRGGVRTNVYKPEVEYWMCVLADKAKELSIPDLTPQVYIVMSGRFKDERRPDMDNLWKVTLDALKMGLGIDDKYFSSSQGEVIIDWISEPALLLEISMVPIVKPDITLLLT